MSLQAFLDRIRYQGSREVSLETLRNLQQAFLLSVPFENFDIHIGRRIEFTCESVYHKIVEQRRGGFCYELNSLFHDMLAQLGFDVRFHGARMVRDGRIGKDRGHMVLVVALDEPWLVDVGNGKSAREPLRLDGTTESRAEDFHYRVRAAEDSPSLLEKPDGADWRQRFVFDVKPLSRSDFIPACEWTQTSPDSIFTQNRICTIARRNGRVLLLNDVLTVSDESGMSEQRIGPEEYSACLKKYFGLDFSEPAVM
jgi:N-hydroxyarylamine O-acetyltransferase